MKKFGWNKLKQTLAKNTNKPNNSNVQATQGKCTHQACCLRFVWLFVCFMFFFVLLTLTAIRSRRIELGSQREGTRSTRETQGAKDKRKKEVVSHQWTASNKGASIKWNATYLPLVHFYLWPCATSYYARALREISNLKFQFKRV